MEAPTPPRAFQFSLKMLLLLTVDIAVTLALVRALLLNDLMLAIVWGLVSGVLGLALAMTLRNQATAETKPADVPVEGEFPKS